MRDATDAETPTGAARVAARARRCGFGVRVTYTRGTVLTARGAPGAVVDSIAVRARHEDGRRAVAVWVRGATGAWKFDMAAVAPIRKVGSAELTKYIEGEQ